MKNKIIATLVVVIGLGGFAYYKMKGDSAPVATKETDTTTSPNTPVVPVDNRKYKNGTYSATGSYTSPAGTENIEVTLVIKDDRVASATFVGKAVNPTSMKLQSMFNAGFSQAVVGKSVDELNLTVVNGSSLTPKGFMEALVKIKAEAKA